MRQPVDLVGGFYTDDTLPWACQDTVNYLPVQTEAAGTRTMTKLVDAPGLKPWLWIGNFAHGVQSAPIRGLHDVEGQLFAVCGRTLYQINNKRVAVPLGTIPGVGRVSMAHNQRSTGNELIVVNGSGGYVWNTATQEFKVVTDEGYPGASVVDFIDGYLMQVEPFGRFLFHSNLADALDYNTLDRFEAETAPDRTLGMIVNHQEVWAFGERTIDVFGNAGTAQGTFQNKGVSISRGCAAKWSPAVIDNGVAWLGDDLKVYHAVGYGPTRISTRAIEVALSECSRTDLRNAFSFVWEDLSHAVYYLTVPNGPTFGFDFSTRLWHRRASWHPERDISGRWRLSDLVRHNGRWIGGDYQTGKLYELDWDYMLEGEGDPLVRERTSGVLHGDQSRFSVNEVELLVVTEHLRESTPARFPPAPHPSDDILWVVSRQDNIYGIKDITTLENPVTGPTGGTGHRTMGAISAFSDAVVSGTASFRYSLSRDSAETFVNEIDSELAAPAKVGARNSRGDIVIPQGPNIVRILAPLYESIDVPANFNDNVEVVIRHGSRLLACLGLAYGGHAVIVSDDDGVTWVEKFHRTTYVGRCTMATDGARVSMLSQAPSGDIIYYSDDGGESWTDSTSTLPVMPPGDGTELFMAANAGGWICTVANICIRSIDGKTWSLSDVSQLNGATIRHCGIAFGLAMVAGEDGLLGYSSDNGVSFSPVAGAEEHNWLTVFPVLVNS